MKKINFFIPTIIVTVLTFNTISCTKTDLTPVTQQISSLQKQNDSLLLLVISLQKSIDSVYSQATLNTSLLNSINGKISSLQTSVSGLISSIATLNTKIDSSNFNINLIQSQLLTLTNQYQSLSSQISSVFSVINIKIDSLSGMINTDTKLLNNLQTQYLVTQIKVDSILLAIRYNNQLLVTNNSNISQIQTQLISLTTEYNNVIILLNQLIYLIDIQMGLSNGLVAYYPFTGNANDVSGNNLNGIVNGAILTTDRYGTANSAYSFNGVNNYIQISHDTSLNTLPISISIWFYYDATSQTNNNGTSLLSKYSGASWNGWNIQISPANSGSINPWYVSSRNNNVIGGYGNPPFYVGNVGDLRWHNVVFTVDSSNGGNLYLDGSLVSTRLWVGTAIKTNNTWPMYFGLYPDPIAGNVYFKGKIDETRIYRRILSQSEISYLAAH